jgi:hypothetical protein
MKIVEDYEGLKRKVREIKDQRNGFKEGKEL